MFWRVVKPMSSSAAETSAIVFCTMLACLMWAKPSLANEDAGVEEVVYRFAEPVTAVDLEETIFMLVQTEDRSGTQRLAEHIEDKDERALEAVGKIAHAAQGGLSAGDSELARMALSLGPCHYANVLVREAVLLISEGGAEPVIRNDVVQIGGTEVDDLYAR